MPVPINDGSPMIPIVMSLKQARAAFASVKVIFQSASMVPNKSAKDEESFADLVGAMVMLAKYIDKAEGRGD